MLKERNPLLAKELDVIMKTVKTERGIHLRLFSVNAPIAFLISRVNCIYRDPGISEDMKFVFRCCTDKIMPFWADGALVFLVDSDFQKSGDYLKMCVKRWETPRQMNRIFVSRCMVDRVLTAMRSVDGPLLRKARPTVQSVHLLPKSLHLVVEENQSETSSDISLKHRGIEKYWDRFSTRGASRISPTYIFNQWKYAKFLHKCSAP